MQNQRQNKNLSIYYLATILSIIPIVLWFFTKKGYIFHVGINPTSRAISNICGLIGTVLICYSMILCILFKGFENFNYLAKPHHKIGNISFVFLFLHSILSAVRYFYFSFNSGIDFVFKDFYLPLTFGKISFIGMVILIIFAFMKFQPKIWIFIHRWFFLIFILAVLHVTFMPSDFNKNFLLKIYIFALMYFTIGLIVYKNFIKKVNEKT